MAPLMQRVMIVDSQPAGARLIGELMRDAEAKVMSIDLNPVLLDTTGRGCVVVDAVVFKG